MTPDFQKVTAANEASRRDTFLAAATARCGTACPVVWEDGHGRRNYAFPT